MVACTYSLHEVYTITNQTQLLQFANPQKVQEMAMQQMMKQMMNQAGMKPPAGGAAKYV